MSTVIQYSHVLYGSTEYCTRTHLLVGLVIYSVQVFTGTSTVQTQYPVRTGTYWKNTPYTKITRTTYRYGPWSSTLTLTSTRQFLLDFFLLDVVYVPRTVLYFVWVTILWILSGRFRFRCLSVRIQIYIVNIRAQGNPNTVQSSKTR